MHMLSGYNKKKFEKSIKITHEFCVIKHGLHVTK